ncbi:MAG: hypothetical protein ACTSUR_08500 [Candidatus Heimdallarchaeaceae archaeon]
MTRVLQADYFWDKREKSIIKKNRELGNIVEYFFVFCFFLLFVFGISGGIYPTLKDLDDQILGKTSSIVATLGYIANRWWLIFLLFFISLMLISLLSLVVSRTKVRDLLTYIEFLKEDLKKTPGNPKRALMRDILYIAGFALISFIFVEIVLLALSSLIFLFISPIIYVKKSFGILYLAVLLVHIIFSPLIVFFYDTLAKKKGELPQGINLDEFLDEEGEVDMRKWRAKTWGKRPYTYNWQEEEYVPITCFSCGSIISSNLTKCPICQADLIKEIEEINSEYLNDNTANTKKEGEESEKKEEEELEKEDEK